MIRRFTFQNWQLFLALFGLVQILAAGCSDTDYKSHGLVLRSKHQPISGVVMAGFLADPSEDLFGLTTYDQWSIGDPGTFLYDSEKDALKIITENDSTNVDGWQANYISPSVQLQAGHMYQFVVRIKSDVFPRGQNVVVKARGPDRARNLEVGWNVSGAGEWEDVILPAYPASDGEWTIRIWTYPTRYAQTPSVIFIDPDVDVFELPFGREVVPRGDIIVDDDKQEFASSTERIDGLGNFYVYQNKAWEHVFPKMIYRSGPNYLELFQRYAEYGFNGVMDVWTQEQAQDVLDSGMRFVSINSNSGTSTFDAMRVYIDRVYGWAESTGHQANIIWYNYDNENESVANYDYQEALADHLDAEHLDPATGTRRHPIYYLNGQFGLPRTYLNDGRHAMDITGSYVGTGGVGEASADLVVPSLAVQFATENQRAPVVVIQLQIYLQEGFVPALFYGISMGGRALCMWRDGTDFGGVDPDFRNAYWAEAFRDEVSPRIDQMLELIEQPHFTTWLAETDHFPLVRVGTRELDGVGYLILSSFADEDLQVQVTLQGYDAVEAVDYFTAEHIADVTDGRFTTSLGHFNHGYRVIKLLADEAPCPDGQVSCSGQCTDLQTDEFNCGSCDNACALDNAGAVCTDGVCEVALCKYGFEDCNGIATDGCEVNIHEDILNCGGCAHECAEGELCAEGVCLGDCPDGLTKCADTCVNLDSSRSHCGSCGNECTGQKVCTGGECKLDCGPGMVERDGVCVSSVSGGCGCGIAMGASESSSGHTGTASFYFLLLVLVMLRRLRCIPS